MPEPELTLHGFGRIIRHGHPGPLHVAGATTTPTLAVWTHHHPVHFFDLADNVFHLVPGDHEAQAAGPEAVRYFEQNYRHRAYKQLLVDLPAQVEACLTGTDFDDLANKRYLGRLTSTAYNARYYVEHQLAGLDYLTFGDWQRQYGRWLVEALGWKRKKVLDVGCACGAILRGLGEADAVVQGVDVNEHMIQLGRQKWPDMTPLLHTCDAVNLHLFGDEAWDAIHSSQVFGTFQPPGSTTDGWASSAFDSPSTTDAERQTPFPFSDPSLKDEGSVKTG